MKITVTDGMGNDELKEINAEKIRGRNYYQNLIS
jgi:hypothetical protein